MLPVGLGQDGGLQSLGTRTVEEAVGCRRQRTNLPGQQPAGQVIEAQHGIAVGKQRGRDILLPSLCLFIQPGMQTLHVLGDHSACPQQHPAGIGLDAGIFHTHGIPPDHGLQAVQYLAAQVGRHSVSALGQGNKEVGAKGRDKVIAFASGPERKARGRQRAAHGGHGLGNVFFPKFANLACIKTCCRKEHAGGPWGLQGGKPWEGSAYLLFCAAEGIVGKPGCQGAEGSHRCACHRKRGFGLEGIEAALNRNFCCPAKWA